MPIIEVDHVTKEFRLGQLTSLGQTFRNGLARLRGKPPTVRAPFKALDDVRFTVEQGEVLGIIGHNGAGKSTLLKLLAGISRPTRGTVRVRGRVAPLIEVGAGLVPDMTGRENIYLNAAILGMKRAEIKRKFAEIVDFAELEEFIDTPIKRYSSGMQVRLGFSIATAVESDLLIIDEVLAVGDISFQRKCFDRMERLIQRADKTVLLVSHNLRQVERLCKRAILLEHGRIACEGRPTTACNMLMESTDQRLLGARAGSPAERPAIVNLCGGDDVVLQRAQIETVDGLPIERLTCGSPLNLRLTLRVNRPVSEPHVGVGVHTPDLLYLCTNESLGRLSVEKWYVGTVEVVAHVPVFPLLPGVFAWRIGIGAGVASEAIFYAENVAPFQVVGDAVSRTRLANQGFVPMPTEWTMRQANDEIGVPTNPNHAGVAA